MINQSVVLQRTLRTMAWCVAAGFGISGVFAQDTLNGVVTDSLFSNALDSVTVTSGSVSVMTDAGGAFSLVIPTTRTLFSTIHGRQSPIRWDASSGLISWSGYSGTVAIRIMDMRGRVAAGCTAGGANRRQEFSLAALPEGIYAISLIIGHQSFSGKYLQLKGEHGAFFGMASPVSGPAPAGALASVAVTTLPHEIVCAKAGYATDSITIAAGTPGATITAIKMIGAAIPRKAIETVQLQANGNPAVFKTALDSGQVFLLKACGALNYPTYSLDAEFGSFSQGASIKDSVGTTDIGISDGMKYQRVLTGVTQGRMRWFGAYNASHIYYLILTGMGKPLTMSIIKADSTAATGGAITVSLVRLSPFPQSFSTQLDSFPVPFTRTIAYSHLSPSKSTVYILSCAGQAKVGGAGLGEGDAEYCDYTATGSGVEDVGDASIDYGVGVDDTNVTSTIPRTTWWGPWRTDHTYYMLYAGTGKPTSFLYFDSNYGANSTTVTMTARLFSAP